MIFEQCVAEAIPFVSPVADFANRLLNGDPSKGDQGLLVRTIEEQDTRYYAEASLLELFRKHDIAVEPPLPPLQYLPASYLHASMRAGGAIFEDRAFPESFTIMIGTKFANNTSMERFQSNGNSVVCDHIYPTDGASVDRASLLGRDYCVSDRLLDICVDGECLANGPKTCGGCKVKPEQYGKLISRWSENVTLSKLHVPWYAACYYDSLQDAVVASNSMWETRERWYIDPNPMGYDGYTECGVSINISELDMADAIIMPLHRTDDRSITHTVCHHPNHFELESRLMMAEKRGYGDHPILWYRESIGIVAAGECARRFNGNGCENSFHKEFFAQEFEFPNKSCVHKPPGCDEVYFFPADDDRCSAHTQKGKERIARLRQAEKQHDARLAWEGMKEKDQQTATSKKHLVRRPQPPTTTSAEARAPTELPMRVYHNPQIYTPWPENAGFLFLGMVMATLMSRKKRRCVHLRISYKANY